MNYDDQINYGTGDSKKSYVGYVDINKYVYKKNSHYSIHMDILCKFIFFIFQVKYIKLHLNIVFVIIFYSKLNGEIITFTTVYYYI